MTMRTGAEYLESLRDGRNVFIDGERIEDVTKHPLTRGYAAQAARFYDLHHQPENEASLTFVDEDGTRRPIGWLYPRNQHDLERRRDYANQVIRSFGGGAFGRLPQSNNGNWYALVDDTTPWAELSKDTPATVDLARNIIVDFEANRDADLWTVPLLNDVQRDRSDPSVAARNPMLRVKERNDEGIVVAGWKGVSTAVIFADTILLGNIVKPGTEPEHIIWASVPVNHPNVTHVGRRSNATPAESVFERPLSSLGDELDSMAYFDDVFIPWEHIYHLGNVDHSRLYAQRTFDFEHADTLHHMIVNAELMTGLAVLVAQSTGTAQHPVVGSDIADLVRFHETLRAFSIASEATAFVTPRGLCKPNNIFYDFGRAHYLENVGRLTEKLVEMCGRSAVLSPSEKDFEVPEIGTRLLEMFHGTTLSAHDKVRLFKFVQDRFLSDWAGRFRSFERFQGTPLFLIKLLTMQRISTDPGGSITELAREAIGLGTTDEMTARAVAERKELFASVTPVASEPALARAAAANQGFSLDDKDQPDYIKTQDA
ncbi:4-hydroxyphenylacetate 3-hydroxylase N-terminal domain-containing protein [Streptomyces sp. NPDC005065]|uniref:4-hydroxyphenylacetate 3-hydroxylase N-terminal domain-containing protein n=1 Tax=Streptomyces sp. NPDC005065 TaxID=3154461 RepID=UPI0033BBE60C